MKNLKINQRIIYIIFALVGFGFLAVLYLSIYRAPQEGIIIPEISGVIEKIEGQTISIKKADSSTATITVDASTRVRAYNTAGTYEAATIENLSVGLSAVAGDIESNKAGYIDAYFPPGERGGIIESIVENNLTINSETHGKFSVRIDDNATIIRSIGENGRFIPGDRTHLSAGKVIVLVQETSDGLATWIDVYPVINFSEESEEE